MKNCLDEATLQAYLDGELSAERTSAATAHVHACASCATAAREASQELAIFATAFGAGEQLSVPTERLRAGVEARIAEMQPTQNPTRVASASFAGRGRAFAASFGARIAFTPRQATAFASFLVAAVLLATIFYVFRTPSRVPQSDKSDREIVSALPSVVAGGAVQSNNEKADTVRNDNQSSDGASEPTNVSRESRTLRSMNAVVVPTRFDVRGRASGGNGAKTKVKSSADEVLLPVEKSYVVAIASLKSSLDAERTRTMTPTLRAEYERNLALVDRAISASRVAARRDPSDKDAREFLRSAYQDKLDLLHTVADQTQIASIAR